MIDKSTKSDKDPDARRFVWKRVFNRLLFYLIAILVIVFLLSKPVVSQPYLEYLTNLFS